MSPVSLLLLAVAAVPSVARLLTNDELRSLYEISSDADLAARRATLQPLRHTAASIRAAVNATLRSAAAARGLFAGSAINCGHLQNVTDPMYTQMANEQYDLATAENSCKFAPIEPSQGSFDFSCCDYVSQDMLAKAQGVFRGHNFVWGVYNPDWLVNGGFSAAELTSIMQTHIAKVAGRYAGTFYSWDVVNEAVEDGNTPVVLKPMAPWYPAVPNYIDLAFTAARAADPKAKLFYNDYGAEDMGNKSDRVYGMVASMKSRGIPIDGVGLQMHISVDAFPDPTQVAANIARLGALGLEVHITEMDVRCTQPCGADRLQLQASIYGNILQACLNNTNCKSFETWGYTDRYTWLWDFNNPTHENVQPLPFDINYAPKPAFYEMIAVLQG